MDWVLFFIVIISVLVFLLLAALVLWVLDSRMEYKRKKTISQKVEREKAYG